MWRSSEETRGEKERVEGEEEVCVCVEGGLEK